MIVRWVPWEINSIKLKNPSQFSRNSLKFSKKIHLLLIFCRLDTFSSLSHPQNHFQTMKSCHIMIFLIFTPSHPILHRINYPQTFTWHATSNERTHCSVECWVLSTIYSSFWGGFFVISTRIFFNLKLLFTLFCTIVRSDNEMNINCVAIMCKKFALKTA